MDKNSAGTESWDGNDWNSARLRAEVDAEIEYARSLRQRANSLMERLALLWKKIGRND